MATSSPASSAAAAVGNVKTIVTETLAGTRVLMTVDGYSKIKETLGVSGSIKSNRFHAGGHNWYIEYYPFDDDEDEDEDEDHPGYDEDDEEEDDDEDWVRASLYLDDPRDGDEVTARYELALLNRDGEIIMWTQRFSTFSSHDDSIGIAELNTSPLLGDCFQVRCDLTVVGKVAVVAAPPDLHRDLGGLLASQLGGDVTFQVGGELFTAHKYILAARSTVFKDELFAPGKENAAAATPIRIDGMEPRVFRALLHFIYTESLPEVNEGDGDDNDKVTMAQGLLAAADRYGVERLKSICADMLSNHIDARTAMDLLQLADSHGCRRLKQACTRVIKDILAKVATP